MGKPVWKIALLLILWGTTSIPLKAQWTLQVKNLRQENSNTRLFLGYKPNESRSRQFRADISIRPVKLEASYVKKRLIIKGKAPRRKAIKRDENQFVGDFFLDPKTLPPILLRKDVELSAFGEEIFFVDLDLPVNQHFQIDVDLVEKESGEHVLLELEEPFLVHNKIRLQTSDLFLSFSNREQDLIQEPFLERVVRVDEPILHYGIYLYARDYDILRIRPILAKETPNPEVPSTQVFESVGEDAIKVLRPGGKRQVLFRDTLELTDLEASTYTLWILIEAGGDEKLERVSFIKGSDISKRIYDELDESIQMMTYITSEEKVSEMLAEKAMGTKLDKFEKIWQKLYGESSQSEMQLYYEKLYEAEERFPEGDIPGWKTERGKTYVLYGEPASTEELSIKGRTYLRWIYPQWSLAFLFEESAGKWKLVNKPK